MSTLAKKWPTLKYITSDNKNTTAIDFFRNINSSAVDNKKIRNREYKNQNCALGSISKEKTSP